MESMDYRRRGSWKPWFLGSHTFCSNFLCPLVNGTLPVSHVHAAFRPSPLAVIAGVPMAGAGNGRNSPFFQFSVLPFLAPRYLTAGFAMLAKFGKSTNCLTFFMIRYWTETLSRVLERGPRAFREHAKSEGESEERQLELWEHRKTLRTQCPVRRSRFRTPMLRPIPTKMSCHRYRFRRCPAAIESQSQNFRRPIQIRSGIRPACRRFRRANPTNPAPTSL